MKFVYRFGREKLSVRENQDRIRLGWSRRNKKIAYACLGFLGLEIYSNYYKTDLKYVFQPTPANMKIINNCQSLRQGVYKPTFYLPTAFLQSLYGSLFESVPYVPMVREKVIVDTEGGTITLDHVQVHSKYDGNDENMRVLLILHGLTGASESNYIRHTALYASRMGFRTICINMRGYAMSQLTSPAVTDYSSLNDLTQAIHAVKLKYQNAHIYCLGYSIGANLLLRYLATQSTNEIKAAVAISTPWNIQELAEAMKAKPIYDYAITRNFKRNMNWNIDLFKQNEKLLGIDIVVSACGLKAIKSGDFDECVTRRILGYKSIEELYSKIECVSAIPNIKIPTLLLSSMDDPVISQDSIPKDQIFNNPNLILAQTQRGSHIEWFSGFKATRVIQHSIDSQQWIKKPAIEFLNHFQQ